MANAAGKRLAQTNESSLNRLHLCSLSINFILLVSYFLGSRPPSIKPYMFFSIPAFLLQYQLEKMGRPTYDQRGSLIRSGDDLAMPGLTEWFHDVIYVTWFCDLLSVLTGSNKVWYLYLLIPGYVAYTVYAKFFAGKSRNPLVAAGEEVQNKSKRQEKLEKRGGQRVKYAR